MPTFANREALSSVRAKINSAIERIDAYGGPPILSYATLAEFQAAVTAGMTMANGLSVVASGQIYVADSTAAISGLPIGWRNSGYVYTYAEVAAWTTAFQEGSQYIIVNEDGYYVAYERDPTASSTDLTTAFGEAFIKRGVNASDLSLLTNEVTDVWIGDGTVGPFPLSVDPVLASRVHVLDPVQQEAGIDYSMVAMPSAASGKGILFVVPPVIGQRIRAQYGAAVDYTVAALTHKTYPTRADMLADSTLLLTLPSGTLVAAAGAVYRRATGATTISDFLGFVPNVEFTPLHWGAAGDGITDDGAKINLALAAYKIAVEAVPNQNGSIVFDGQGKTYRSTVSLNFTGVTAWGANIRNLTILSEATGKTAFDMIGTRGATLTEVLVYGHSTNTPRVGIQQARALVGGQEAFADHIIFNGCGTRGYFTLAGIYNYGGECNTHNSCDWWNSHKDGISAIFLGTDVYSVASDYLTPVTGETSFLNNLYNRCDFRHLPLGRTSFITAATNTNPLTVTVASGSIYTIGDNVVFGSTPDAQIIGMPELNQLKAQITGIAGNVLTFGAVNASGWAAYTSGGQATVAQTAPSLVFGRGRGHKFQSCYIVNYGTDAVEISMSTSVEQIVALDFDSVLFEGDGQRSHIRFLVGTAVRSLRDFKVSTLNFRPQAFAISTDATGGGLVQIQGGELSFPVETSNGIPKLFEDETKFSLYNMTITVPEPASIIPSSFIALGGKIHDVSTGFAEYFFHRTNGHTRSKIATGAAYVDHQYLDDAGVVAGFTRFNTAAGGAFGVSVDGVSQTYFCAASALHPATNDTLDLGLTNRYWQDIYVNRIQKALAVESLGYAAGAAAGGTVVQATSKATAVTLNKRTGTITSSADALAGATSVAFRMNNSLLTATSLLIVNPRLPTGKYRVEVSGVDTGFADLRITNLTGGSLSEAITIGFAIINGADT